MTYLPFDFLKNLRTNKFVQGEEYMKNLIDVNWDRFMRKHLRLTNANNGPIEQELDPRLQSSKIWALDLNYHHQIEIHV